MNIFKQRCIELRKDDRSIIEIMRITGRPKTSIYQHIRSIPLSTERLERYRTASGRRIRKFTVARKGKSARSFRAFSAWSPETVLLAAHLLFDGEISRKICTYNNRSRALIERVERLMQSIYDFEPKRYKNQITGVNRISYHNVALGAYLQKRTLELLREIKILPPSFKREFLRAFFDDEGCMDFRPENNRRRIRGYQKDMRILRLVRIILDDLGIPARVVRPNEVVIVGKGNLEKFEKEINFSSGVYINGNRTNSRWKKHLEKREILRRAIASFKS